MRDKQSKKIGYKTDYEFMQTMRYNESMNGAGFQVKPLSTLRPKLPLLEQFFQVDNHSLCKDFLFVFLYTLFCSVILQSLYTTKFVISYKTLIYAIFYKTIPIYILTQVTVYKFHKCLYNSI